jgi:hypothetical protein
VDDLPQPLVDASVELKDFPFTPLYRARLFGSEFHSHASDSEWRAGVTLWLKSWDQSPAGSLPNNEVALCRLAELGKDLKAWRKLAPGAMHGWVLCSDGRLYHPVVAEGINDAWQRKQAQRDRTKAARATAAVAKRATMSVTDAVTASAVRSATAAVTASKRQGQYKGQETGTETSLHTGSKEPERESRAREAPGQEALSQSIDKFEIGEEEIAAVAQARDDAGLPPVNLRAEATKFLHAERVYPSYSAWMRWGINARADLSPSPNGHDPPTVYKPDVPDGPPPPFVWTPPEENP